MHLARGSTRTVVALIAAAALVAGIVSAPSWATKRTVTTSPQVVLDWHTTAVATVLAGGANQAEAAIYIGLTQAAVYDAVIAIEKGFQPYLIVPGVPPGASADAAAVAAAYWVLVTYFPNQKPALDTAYAASLAAITDGPAKDRGILVGQQVATGLVAARTDDGRNAPIAFTPAPGPGVWRPTPPALLPALSPWMASVKPLLLNRPDQFRPGPPPALNSRLYARDFEETRLYGAKASSVRTAEQTETARFWTENVPQQLNRTLHNLVVRLGLDLRQTARALAMATTTMADALIACWDAKYTYGFWRPVTAIRLADTDGNDQTVADPAWEPLLPTPNHPEYTSAHNCVTAALGATAANLVGSDRIDLDIISTVTGTTKHYSTLRDLERDIVNARVWVGYHWRTSDEAGYRLGDRVARWALQRNFRPSHH
jgi:hypothetical protein